VDATSASQLLDNIHRARVQRCGCAQTSGLREFFVGDINGSHDRPQPLPNLHSQVTQSTDAKNRQPLAWLDFGLSQGSTDRDSGTEKRRGFDAGESFRNLHGMTRRSLHEFRVSAVHRNACDLLFNAEILVAFVAELASAASPMHPRNAYAVAHLQMIDRGAFFDDSTGNFVPENQGSLGDRNELRPISISNVQV
jgi:hypothetical protein